MRIFIWLLIASSSLFILNVAYSIMDELSYSGISLSDMLFWNPFGYMFLFFIAMWIYLIFTPGSKKDKNI